MTVRAFIAIELHAAVKASIAAAIDQLRRERIHNLRLVRPEGVHLTLKFLGDIPASQVPAIARAMTHAAAGNAPFTLTLGAPGVFPSPNRARVLWLGVDGDPNPLDRLQSAVEDALSPLGFAPENRPFNPHLTIGRMRPRASHADRRRAVHALAALPVPASQAIEVNAVSLMKSVLLPEGALYERIAHSPLAAPA